jgi:heme o synthase
MLQRNRSYNWVSRASDYWTLTKPEVNFLVLASTLAGFYLGCRGPLNFGRLVHTLLGTLLVASGTATLNQYAERRQDARMRRTAQRPLPSGRMAPVEALVFGLLCSAAGGLYLWVAVNSLASALALLTLGTYLLAYTPLKRRTPLCTLVGAFPGAMPPLIGWAAARGTLSPEAWILYAILFFWQFPHFLAIAWMYREDYARAGLQMLPLNDVDGRFTSGEIVAFTAALLPVSVLPALLSHASVGYLLAALMLGLLFLQCGTHLAVTRSKKLARRLVMASVIYLPLIFGLLMVDRFLASS